MLSAIFIQKLMNLYDAFLSKSEIKNSGDHLISVSKSNDSVLGKFWILWSNVLDHHFFQFHQRAGSLGVKYICVEFVDDTKKFNRKLMHNEWHTGVMIRFYYTE